MSWWSVSGRGCAGRRACAVPLGKPAQHPVVRGFPGFVSKPWLAGDEHGFYRGLYGWNGPARAEHCARCLWRVLAPVPVPGSIGYRIVPGIRPAGAFSDASATVPEQVTMWLPMVPRSRARAAGNRLGRIKGQDGQASCESSARWAISVGTGLDLGCKGGDRAGLLTRISGAAPGNYQYGPMALHANERSAAPAGAWW